MATVAEILEHHPLKQQKIAQDMAIEERGKKILFSVITPLGAAECVWLDPHMGLFQICNRKKESAFHVKDLPEGTIIVGTRYGGVMDDE